jgi:peptidoglycan/xylan/chitin deacetylase (PgdA/CDA1 family)
MFERQLAYLKKNGWRSFTMREAYEMRNELPPKSVVITFDDGYRDNLTQALPLLEKYDFKATIYLVWDRHDRDWSGERKAKNIGAGLKEEAKLTDKDIETLLHSGRIEIASHTLRHINLAKVDEATREEELCESRRKIRERFDVICDGFAYPFGIYTDNDKKILQQCGYTHAVTTQAGIADLRTCDPFAIPRITVSGKDNLLAFKLKLKTGKRGVKR